VTVTATTGSTPTPTPTPTLTANGYKSKGWPTAELKWTGFSTGTVDIYRNGTLLLTTANDGSHTDTITGSRKGSYVYKTCVAGTSTCSNEAFVSF
jgi:hypothetical protein